MDRSGIKNRWQDAFGQKKLVDTSMPSDRREKLESTISLLTEMNRLNQLLEIIREHREIYNEPWLLQVESSVERQLNVSEETPEDGNLSPLPASDDDLWEATDTDDDHDVDKAAPAFALTSPVAVQAELTLTHADAESVVSEVAASETARVPIRRGFHLPRVGKSFTLDFDGDEPSALAPEPVAPAMLASQNAVLDVPAQGEEDDRALPAPDTEETVFDPDDDLDDALGSEVLALDEVVESPEVFASDDDPEAWHDELDLDFQDLMGELQQRVEPLTRIAQAARARQVASELIANHDWPHSALPILTEVLNRKSYGAIKAALDRLMTHGMTLEMLVLASQIRAIWHDSPAYWVSFRASGEPGEGQYVLSWPAAINVLNAFPELPSIEEVEWFLDTQLDYWMSRRSLRACFRSFRLYLWFRTSGLKGTLPPDQHYNFDSLPYES